MSGYGYTQSDTTASSSSAPFSLCDDSDSACTTSVRYSGVEANGISKAKWVIEGGLNNLQPVAEETIQSAYNPLFGRRVGEHLCGDVLATSDSTDSNGFTVQGSFNVCSGTISDMSLPVTDTLANLRAQQRTQVLADMQRTNLNTMPPLMSKLSSDGDGCSVMEKLIPIPEWDVGRATIDVHRSVECFLCKATMPNLQRFDIDPFDSTDSGFFTDSQLSNLIDTYCVTVPCEDSELDSSSGHVCFADKFGKFDCTEPLMTPNAIIQRRVYGTTDKPTTACGPMKTIGRAIASEWSHEVREAIQ